MLQNTYVVMVMLGGVAVSKDLDYIQKLKFDYMYEFGGVMSPFNAWLMLRGLKH